MLDKIQPYIEGLLSEQACKRLKFHNISHTKGVVEKVNAIAKGEQITGDDMEALLIAAWFHDVGYIQNPKNHEEISCEMAFEFLDQYDYKPELKETIRSLILVTKMGTVPTTLLEKVMKDADLGHIGTHAYPETAHELREEWKILNGTEMSNLEWFKTNYDFLTNHTFYTQTAESLFGEQKRKNLAQLNAMIQMENNPSPKKEKAKKKSNIDKLNTTEKGRETAYRVALRNHIQLSKIADNKANIMLSVNALILSFILGSSPPIEEESMALVVPTLILVLSSVLSIIFATLSTRPKVTHGNISRQEIADKKGNLLFFGNFHAMDLETYEWGMSELMKDPEYLYNSLNRDLFFLGKVLNRKYMWLSATYITFATGMILSTLMFFGVTFRYLM